MEPCAKRKLKRIGRSLLLAVLLLPVLAAVFFLLFFCADTYRDTAEFEDLTVAYGYYTGIHRLLGQDHAAVTEYRAVGREITIPERYGDTEIRELGAFLGRGVPIPFRVTTERMDELGKEALTVYEISFSAAAETGRSFDEVIYEDVTLCIGERIEAINADAPVTVFELPDGQTVACCVRFYVKCHEENENFYSQNGILYNRDGTVFDDFVYAEQKI